MDRVEALEEPPTPMAAGPSVSTASEGMAAVWSKEYLRKFGKVNILEMEGINCLLEGLASSSLCAYLGLSFDEVAVLLAKKRFAQFSPRTPRDRIFL